MMAVLQLSRPLRRAVGARTAVGVADGIRLGRQISGEPLVMARPSGDPLHALISGCSGAGKTVTLRVWTGGLAGLDDVALVGLDPKRTGLAPWAPRFTTIARTVEESTVTLVLLWQEVNRRLDLMAEMGVTGWRTEFGGPFIGVIVDELVQVLAADGTRVADVLAADAESIGLSMELAGDRVTMNKTLRAERTGAKESQQVRGLFLATLARLCREAGVQLITATQYPLADDLDSQLLANLQVRLMHRVTSDHMIPVCLGQGVEGITHRSISAEERGGMWVDGIGSARPIRARASFVSDAAVAARARATAHLRWAPEQVFQTATAADEARLVEELETDGEIVVEDRVDTVLAVRVPVFGGAA